MPPKKKQNKRGGAGPKTAAPAPEPVVEEATGPRAEALKFKALGNEAFTAGNFQLGVEHFTNAIKSDPKDHVFWSNRSACHASLLQFKEAVTDATECVKLAPQWPKGYSRLGFAKMKSGDLQGALKAYKAGLSVDPGNGALKDGEADVKVAMKRAIENNVNQQRAAGAGEASGEPVIGIDLGTTFSCVAVWRNGEAEVLANDVGDRTTASWVAFTEEGERLVGDSAKRQAAMNPERTLFNIKRIIGRTFAECGEEIKRFPFEVTEGPGGKPLVEVEVQGEIRKMMPEEISSMVLTKMKETAETALGCKVSKAVVTVPAYFNDAQRRLTKDAGALAGLEVLRIINEPTAAALAYGLDQQKDGESAGDQTILVFDLGGGTFDVSLLSIEGGVFNVLATAGDTHLGGEDFDSTLADWTKKEIQRKHKADPFTGNARNERRLRASCETTKRGLSSAMSGNIEFSAGDEEYSIPITRAKFEQLNDQIFTRCLDAVKRCMLDAKKEKTDVDEIVLVGGSTRVPKVQAVLSEFFGGKALNKSVHPDEAVAFGAAVQGAILSGVRDANTAGLLLVDVVPLSLGVECEGREFSRVINRNTAIPCRKTKEFTTVEDYQTEVDMRVFEGERAVTDGNNLLGEFQITGIQRAKRGEACIIVSFEVNANGLLTCSAEDKVTGAKAQVDIDNKHGQLSPEEMDRMMKEAERYRAQDEARTKQAEERREREYYEAQQQAMGNFA